MVEISVIVPVYNAAAYLRDALKTYLNQTFRNIELILINDGSTDGSLEIIREFERIDSRIIVFDGENRGVDAARNTGLEMAQGKYISFLDADDIAEETMLEKLYNKIESEGSDLVICGYKNIKINGKVTEYGTKAKETINIEDKAGRIRLMNSYIPGNDDYSQTLWNKLFSKDIIKRNNIEFKSHKHLYCEDTAFCYEYMLYVNSICFVEEALYTYIKRPLSITTSYISDSLVRFNNYFIYIKEILQKSELYEECKEAVALLAFTILIHMQYREMKYKKPFPEKWKTMNAIQNDLNFRRIIEYNKVSDLSLKRKFIYFCYMFRLKLVMYLLFALFVKIKE